MKVGDLMATELVTVEPHLDAGLALALMYEFDIRRLPVLDGESGRLIGIVTDRDLRLAIQSPFLGGDDNEAIAALEDLLIGEIMQTDLVVIGPGASIGDAARRMLSHKVGGMPVVELDPEGEATLVGLITASDLLRYLADREGPPPMEG